MLELLQRIQFHPRKHDHDGSDLNQAVKAAWPRGSFCSSQILEYEELDCEAFDEANDQDIKTYPKVLLSPVNVERFAILHTLKEVVEDCPASDQVFSIIFSGFHVFKVFKECNFCTNNVLRSFDSFPLSKLSNIVAIP